MKKISAIISVYNEEKLLPLVLKNIEPHVDEIVIVDGSPDGPSTDETKNIAESCEKVLYQSGTFKTLDRDGAWDMATQQNAGINAATGDLMLFISADMLFVNLESLRAAAESETAKIFFCPTIEFWLDTIHLRIYSADTDVLTLPSNILEPVAVSRELNPYCEDNGKFKLEQSAMSQRMMLPQLFKYHLGWIRPFGQQVAKHINHVKQHRWGEHGEKLLQGSARGLEQWAMLHVLSYPQIPAIDFVGELPPEMETLMDMKYDDGAEAVTKDFERRFRVSIFKMRSDDE